MSRWLDQWRFVRDPERRRAKSSKRKGEPTVEIRLLNPWHAVSIEAGKGACEAVRALQGQRYLSSGSPPLIPLKECDAARCRCRYKHHDDRRSGTSITDPFKTLQAHPMRRRTDGPTF